MKLRIWFQVQFFKKHIPIVVLFPIQKKTDWVSDPVAAEIGS
jgi:hypothetical protein